jgi:hypothetical protein
LTYVEVERERSIKKRRYAMIAMALKFELEL